MNTLNVAQISLGSQDAVTTMFAYPNTGHTEETLADTIEHYLRMSMVRENLSTVTVTTVNVNGSWTLCVEADDADTVKLISDYYQAFFNIGQIGLQAAAAFQKTGKWASDWQFFLPLGVPLAKARAVELMDFPPLTLISEQDYLNSKTTSRWWSLLILNGVEDAEKCLYSCILDIVPVAAPASDGQKLEAANIYGGPFDSYGLPLLEKLVLIAGEKSHRPLIALGMPIRDWIKRIWGLMLEVGQIGTLTLKDGDVINVIGCNHPSFFYYAVHSASGPGAPEKNLAAGLAVMKQDIVCAAWHAGMGKTPSADPKQVLIDATNFWATKDAELLALVKEQAGPDITATLPVGVSVTVDTLRPLEPTSEELAELEKQFYAKGGAHRG